jgi:hypothetical protein
MADWLRVVSYDVAYDKLGACCVDCCPHAVEQLMKQPGEFYVGDLGKDHIVVQYLDTFSPWQEYMDEEFRRMTPSQQKRRTTALTKRAERKAAGEKIKRRTPDTRECINMTQRSLFMRDHMLLAGLTNDVRPVVRAALAENQQNVSMKFPVIAYQFKILYDTLARQKDVAIWADVTSAARKRGLSRVDTDVTSEPIPKLDTCDEETRYRHRENRKGLNVEYGMNWLLSRGFDDKADILRSLGNRDGARDAADALTQALGLKLKDLVNDSRF